jgi:hypothetical protein
MEDPARLSIGSRPPGRRRFRTRLTRVLVVLGIAGLLGLAGLPGLPGSPRLVSGEDPAAEVTAAVQRFGVSGTLWGRLAVEEESPDGAWTPLGAVEIALYPAVPSLVAELEQIRQSARGSGAEYESAISRLQAVLAAHQIRVQTVLHGAPPPPKPSDQPKASEPRRSWWAPAKPGRKADADKADAGKADAGKTDAGKAEAGKTETGKTEAAKADAGKTETGKTEAAKAAAGPAEAGKPGEGPAKSDCPGQGGKASPGAEAAPGSHPAKPGGGSGKTGVAPCWRRTTDPAGLFVFDELPSGDWLLVAIRVTPYSPSRGHQEAKKPSPSRAKSFLPTPSVAFKEAEVWLTRVRVPPGDRTALLLTDRARWMVGPVR